MHLDVEDLSDRIDILKGDITVLEVDMIVNAAHKSLLGGGGVDGAIHRAAGPGLVAECRALGGCPTGEVRLTGGHNLRARYIVHAVGPIYQDGRQGEPDLLRSCYEGALRLAEQHEVQAIAFPCISTGAYGYPKEEASQIAVETVVNWLTEHKAPRQVIFCCFEPIDAKLYRKRLDAIFPSGD